MRVLIPALILTTVACGNSSTQPGGTVCTAVAAAGVSLSIADSITGQGAALTGVWARARDGSYVDSTGLVFNDSQTGVVRAALAFERAGTYAVTVHADGYKDWSKTGVVVTKDVCHVIGVALSARMVK